MNIRHLFFFGCVLLALGGCEPTANQGAEGATAAHAPAADFERGPHRGRLLRDGDLALELQIFEDGVPPEYHVYLFDKGQTLPPSAATVTVQLTRLDGEVNRFTFAPERDFLKGEGVVHEPHSFSVVVEAQRQGKVHRWTFDSFEGRTTIPAATAKDAGLEVETAGPAQIADTLTLNGRIVPNQERMRAVTARFSGQVRTVQHSVGDVVKAGDTLATVESNDSLQVYAVTAPIGGTIIERHANPGEAVGESPIFVIADYSSLWAELSAFPRDVSRLRVGQPLRVQAVDGDAEVHGTIARLAPAAGGGAGLYSARVVLDNRDRRWVPGQFVRGTVQVGARRVRLAVKRSGLQAFRDFTVVFEQVGETYEVRMLELGAQDDTWVEVLGGLKSGVNYVTENSYLIKADIEKSGASHDH
jgi:cobalt-zinc-cadmium efflux system membrane fusion protein